MVTQAGFKLMIILLCPNLSNARVTGGNLHTQLQYFLEHCRHYDTWTCHGYRDHDVLRGKRNYQSEFTLCWSHPEDTSTYFLTALMIPFPWPDREVKCSHGSLSLPDNYTVLFTVSGSQ